MESRLKRTAIYFDARDNLAGMHFFASDDVMVQIRRVLGRDAPERTMGILMLNVEQAVKLAEDAGRCTELTSPDWDATIAIYEGLVYKIFNVFWGEGLDGALAGIGSY